MDVLTEENILIIRTFLGKKSEGKIVKGKLEKVQVTITVENELIYDKTTDWIDNEDINTPVIFLYKWLARGSSNNMKCNCQRCHGFIPVDLSNLVKSCQKYQSRPLTLPPKLQHEIDEFLLAALQSGASTNPNGFFQNLLSICKWR